jgi:hypothetical protein
MLRTLSFGSASHMVAQTLALAMALGCSNGTDVPAVAATDAGTGTPVSAPVPDSPGDAEMPATGRAELIGDWIASGAYRAWTCEKAGHDARSPSPHGRNRICNNRKVVEHSTGEYPAGSASVKELFDDLGKLKGHSLSVKLGPGKAASWVWYMEIDGAVLLNGRGDTPGPSTECVGCHAGAGSDAKHSGHDFVYTQLPL